MLHAGGIKMVSSLFRFFLAVGSEWVLWLMTAVSVMALTVFFDRWRYIRNQERVGFALWKSELQDWLSAGIPADWQKKAEDIKTRYPCPEARVLHALAKAGHVDAEDIERQAQSIMSSERVLLDKNLGVLGTLGNSAPFIGLFGTVLGIIKAFAELDKSSANSGLATVSGGLAEALVTTAAGLLIAIPCVVAYNFYQRKIKNINARVNSLAGIIAVRKNQKSGA